MTTKIYWGLDLYVFQFKHFKKMADYFDQLESHFQNGDEPIEMLHESKRVGNQAHAHLIFIKSFTIGYFKQRFPWRIDIFN